MEDIKDQGNLKKIIELIKDEASDGVDFMALINSSSFLIKLFVFVYFKKTSSGEINKEFASHDSLLWNISLASNLLASESWFITKIYTNFWPKTNEYLFLIYALFEKVYIFKPFSSSFLSEV